MIKETVPGVVGNCTTVASFTLAWFTLNGEPMLHILSVVAGIVASIATAAYYILEWRAVRKAGDKKADRRATRRRIVRRKKVAALKR